MTVTALPQYRLLNEHLFADLVKSVDCSNPKNVVITFDSSSSVSKAAAAWSWVKQDAANTLIFLADAAGCGGVEGRTPYHVNNVAYSDNTATLSVVATNNWNDFIEDADVHITGSEVVRKRKSVSKKVKLSLEHTYNKVFYQADIGPAHLVVECKDCGSHGSLDTDITISTKDGFSASALTTDGVYFQLAIGVTVSASIKTSVLTDSIVIEKFSLGKFKIADIVKLEPEITLQGQITVSDISGSVGTVVGAKMVVPDGQTVAFGKGSTAFNPTFQRINPTVSAQVSMTARINPLLTLDISGDILGKDVTGGLALAAPYLDFKAGADVNAPNTCDNGTSSLHYSVDVGVELDSFYGFGKPGDLPHKNAIYQRSEPLLKDCIAITH